MYIGIFYDGYRAVEAAYDYQNPENWDNYIANHQGNIRERCQDPFIYGIILIKKGPNTFSLFWPGPTRATMSLATTASPPAPAKPVPPPSRKTPMPRVARRSPKFSLNRSTSPRPATTSEKVSGPFFHEERYGPP
jgi:hypothetical protein